MECTNCKSFVNMMKVANGNISSILSGYDLVLKILNDHENQISKLKSENEIITASFNNIKSDTEDITSCSLTNIAANEEVQNLSNVDVEDTLAFLTHQFDGINPQLPVIPKPEVSNSITLDYISDASHINNDNYDIIDSDSSFDRSDDSSYDSSNSSSTNTDSISSLDGSSTTCDSKCHESESTLNNTVCSTVEPHTMISGFKSTMENLPYEAHDSQIFSLFEPGRLDDSTTYTHFFANRSAAYYGIYPYCYGKISHEARDISQNPYLGKLLKYVEIAYPAIPFNSVMVHKYNSGNQYIPHHSDDEKEIVDDSLIVTISLGASRTFEFKDKEGGVWNKRILLNHGDSLVMSKKSQQYFTHGLPKEVNKGMRLSITLRLIKPKMLSSSYNVIASQTDQFVQTCEVPTTTSPVTISPVTTSPVTTAPVTTSPVIPAPNFNPENASPVLDQLFDGYQVTQTINENNLNYSPTRTHSSQPIMPSKDRVRYESNDNNRNPTSYQKKCVDTLYVSSSMFRHLDPRKLSTEKQDAQVLFYPGADAHQMEVRLIRDPKFAVIEKKNVKKIFVMVGTNNIDSIFNGTCSSSNTENDISNLLYFLWFTCPNAKLHVINLLPRQDPQKNAIVNNINQYTYNLCQVHGLKFVNTEHSENTCFSHNGIRKGELFAGGYDNVHLSNRGYTVLARNLKYLAHI